MADAATTMEEIDREHREERARDAERLRTGQISAEELQEENSIVPWSCTSRIINLAASLERVYMARA